MRIGYVYRLYKEGKIEMSKEEMSQLWGFYDSLSPWNASDRKFLDGYKYIVGELSGENPFQDGKEWSEEEKKEYFETAVNTLRRYATALTHGKLPRY